MFHAHTHTHSHGAMEVKVNSQTRHIQMLTDTYNGTYLSACVYHAEQTALLITLTSTTCTLHTLVRRASSLSRTAYSQ